MNQPRTRVEREQELRQAARTQCGHDYVMALYLKARGVPAGTGFPIGISTASMVETILAREFAVRPR